MFDEDEIDKFLSAIKQSQKDEYERIERDKKWQKELDDIMSGKDSLLEDLDKQMADIDKQFSDMLKSFERPTRTQRRNDRYDNVMDELENILRPNPKRIH